MNAPVDHLRTGQTWQQMLARRSFIELDALARCTFLLDNGTLRVLADPFARLESPWLEPQGITPQSDDGVVIARGTVDRTPVVVAAIEQHFQGGAIGEVSGAKIAQGLLLAAAESRAGAPVAAVILFETGGVRLQEANLGLNAVAEICSALLDLRPLAPVIGVVAGTVGSFGGMSIAAGLCTRLIVTPQARIGLNGPEVIEQEHGIDEFDSCDRALVWSVDGGRARHAAALADDLVPDDADRIRSTVVAALRAGVPPSGQHRSERIDLLARRLATVDRIEPPTAEQLHQIARPTCHPRTALTPPDSRGRTWLAALTAGHTTEPVIPSVLRVLTDTALYLAVIPDPDNAYRCARNGEVGLTEALALAQAIHELIDADRSATAKRAVVAIVDLPSQAYGRVEEIVGLHQAMATTVDAYHTARTTGHPVIALVVGTALSGGFLTHGLQANQILALDDPGVQINAMHRDAAARVTQRTVKELDDLANTIAPLSYRVSDWATLGFCDERLSVDDADTPTQHDVTAVTTAIAEAVERARHGPTDLSNRLDSPAAQRTRHASRAVRDVLARQWNGPGRS
ncbi:biotin-independent malonate decarboxylase subunit beta [Mycobacterium riyadhense]|uniref:biotin-independent malonate decarboxylase subunit beta n=1 Tax=Mycobacterium riyadhense TaxID=486698 RepID=UPI00194E6BB6|nr:biotin-independent malonate decarboxylase subunit beta [Mycobacterium riyadhense]